tara:strand:- start:4143 stop:4499 length:357 start_codon:yes stop_codon:yes gene_type:complete
METTQAIYSRLKSADNKQLWAFAQELNSANKRAEKAETKAKKTTKESVVDLNDKENLRQSVLEHLYAESSKGNAQASDKLARLAGLGEETQDIIIEIVNYDDVKKPPKKVRKKSKPTK